MQTDNNIIMITQLEPVSRHKVRMIINDDPDSVMILSDKTVFLYHLQSGEYISETVWNELMAQMLHQAIQKCGMLLKGMDYSGQALRNKLVRSGIPADIAAKAVEQMSEAGYINDRRLAAAYLRYHINDRSLQRIRQDLKNKGIPQDIIQEVIDETSREIPDDSDASLNRLEQAQIQKLLEKRHFTPDGASYEDIQKTIAFLMGRGYSAENIRIVMRNFIN